MEGFRVMMFEEWNARKYIEEWTEKVRQLNMDIEDIEDWMQHFHVDRRRTEDALLYTQLQQMKILSAVMIKRLDFLKEKYKDDWYIKEVNENGN